MTNERKFTITDSVLFALVMEDLEICAEFLEMLFQGRKIKKIKLKERVSLDIEKTIIPDFESKKVRLDVLFEDETTVYDIEMQIEPNKNLAKRMRYYSGVMDSKYLKEGDDYDNLKPSYIIFICDFDFGKLDQPVYFFETIDRKNDLKLGDESYKIVLKTKCRKDTVPKGLASFFKYINAGTIDPEDHLVIGISEKIEQIKLRKEVRNIMTLEEEIMLQLKWAKQDGHDEGLKEGVERGKREEKISTARKLLDAMVDISVISNVTGFTEEQIVNLNK